MSDLTPVFQHIAVVAVQRVADVQRVEEMAGGVYKIVGTIAFTGAGEGIFPVNFPITFIESPAISTGGEMGPSSALVSGSYPTVNGVVKDWAYIVRPDTGQQLFSGCTFALVIGGTAAQDGLFHYQLEGLALRNPI